MLQELQKQGGRRLLIFSESMRQWAGSIVLAIAVAITYFLASWLSFFLRTKPDDVAWFWPAAGVAAGALIARPRHKIAGGCRDDGREHPGQSLGPLELLDFHRLRPV